MRESRKRKERRGEEEKRGEERMEEKKEGGGRTGEEEREGERTLFPRAYKGLVWFSVEITTWVFLFLPHLPRNGMDLDNIGYNILHPSAESLCSSCNQNNPTLNTIPTRIHFSQQRWEQSMAD